MPNHPQDSVPQLPLPSDPSSQLSTPAGAIVPRVKIRQGKAVKQLRPKVTLLISSQRRSSPPHYVTSLLAMFILLSTAGLIAGGAWVGIQLMINPRAVSWLNYLVPGWVTVSYELEAPHTLKEIREELRQAGLFAGDPYPLMANTDNTTGENVVDLLLPVLKRQGGCQNNCDEIVELRVYQPTQSFSRRLRQPAFRLIDRVSVAGPREFSAIAPLTKTSSDVQGSSRLLPLNRVSLISGKAPESGVWLHLSGKWTRGNIDLAYGQVIRYDIGYRLHLMEQWTSPAGQLPKWQEVTGGGLPELVVDQTVGLEPQFQVYRAKSLSNGTNPTQLAAIALAEPALKGGGYEKALLLARNGLWSLSVQWLESLKRQSENGAISWSTEAQAQMDLIKLHAQVTKAQAEKSWASPSQQILAQLIDGRWTRALQLFQRSPEYHQGIANLLKADADSGRLWDRVVTALRIEPNQPDVQAWGTMLLSAQQGRPAAIAWLQQQRKTLTADTRILALLNQLDGVAIATSPTNATSYVSRIIGTASVMTQIKPSDWLQPQQSRLQLADQQVWYQIRVSRFHDGSRWQQAPFSTLRLPSTGAGQQLWSLLGLNNDAQIQLIVWDANNQSYSLWGTVKAVQLRNGVLQLLAAGESLPSEVSASSAQPLALTTAALQWVEPSNFMTLADLNQQQPAWASTIMSTLWSELQKMGQVPAIAADQEAILQQVGSWQVQLVEVTGDDQAEAVLTVALETLTNLATSSNPQNTQTDISPAPQPRTLIFSSTGSVIYNELGASERALRAIANLGDGAALVVDGPQNYNFQRWSAQRQRFE